MTAMPSVIEVMANVTGGPIALETVWDAPGATPIEAVTIHVVTLPATTTAVESVGGVQSVDAWISAGQIEVVSITPVALAFAPQEALGIELVLDGLKGATGAPGATGDAGPPAWKPVATWLPGGVYGVGPPADVVTFAWSTYVCAVDHTATVTFDPTKWIRIAGGSGDVLQTQIDETNAVLTNLQSTIAIDIGQIDAAVAAAETAVLTVRDDLASANAEIASARGDVQALLNEIGIASENVLTIRNELSARVDDVFAWAQSTAEAGLQALHDAREARISLQTEISVRASETEALVSEVTILGAGIAGNVAAIITEQNARATADEALANTLTVVSASVATNTAAISSEATARADADAATAATLTAVQTAVGDNTAAITAETVARTDADTALSASISSLTATVGANTAAISAEAATRATADTATSARIDTVEATVATNTAAISAEAITRSTQDTALAAQITSLSSTVASNTAAITAEQATRASADDATAYQVSALTSGQDMTAADAFEWTQQIADAGLSALVGLQDARAAVRTEALTRSTETSALAAQVTSVAAALGEQGALIASETLARVDGDTALAAQVSSLTTAAADNAAAIASEAATRASADGATAYQVSAIVAGQAMDAADAFDWAQATAEAGLRSIVGLHDAGAQIRAEAIARTTETSALATQVAALSASLGDAQAMINTESTARVDGDSVLAGQMTAVQTTVGDNTAAITALQVSDSGQNARWSISYNVNGYVQGAVTLDGMGSQSTFGVLANNFFVAQPGVPGGTAVQVFAVGTVNGAPGLVVNGSLQADGAILARHLSVTSLDAVTSNIGTMNAGRLQRPDGLMVVDLDNLALRISYPGPLDLRFAFNAIHAMGL